jgi:hypothetical protein
LAKALEFNHVLQGMHVEGNHCEYNSKGFLVPEKKENILINVMGTRIKRLHGTKPAEKTLCENCWICGGWRAVTIEWGLEETGWTGKLY